jgi:predicted Zn-dependent protease
LSSALSKFPSAPSLILLSARSELRAGRLDAAMMRLALLTERRDELGAAALAWRASAELASGRATDAVTSARRALSLEPHQEVATVTLALALSELGAPEAPAWVARARQISPRDPLLARLAR